MENFLSMKKLILSFCLISVFSFSVKSQSDTYSNEVEELFENTKEVYFTFQVNSPLEIGILTQIISIDHVSGNTVKAFANKKGYNRFLKYGYAHSFLMLPKDEFQMQLSSLDEITNQHKVVSTYPTYSQYESMMQQFATDYPSLCKLYELGTLPSGRKILALKITDNPNQSENEPEFFYTSTMHGDETAGYPMMLSLIEHLLSNYGSNSRITSLVNNIEIWINPLANPDGTYAGGNNTVSGATRYNDNGVDLNRNFPDPQFGLHPDGEAWQPETIIFMGFADTMNFVMSANFHGGAEVLNFPWDTWPNAHADENWWIRESRKYADSCQLNGAAGYMDDLYSGTYPGVTNGYDWYQITGGRQDYMQWYHHCREVTIELSTQKLLSASSLSDHFYYNLPSLLNYIESSLHGIRGVVTDQCTGNPVKAKVFITSHDFDSTHVYSTSDVGDYHRPIYTGTYTLVISAPGYQSQTFNNVNVSSFTSSTVVNAQLVPLTPTANFTASAPQGCTGEVSFTDLTGGVNSWSWDFGDGNTSTDQNPSHTYAAGGTYTVSLTVGNCAGSDNLTQNNFITLSVSTPPTTVNDTTFGCTPISFLLSAGGSGNLNWYDAASGGNLVNTGNTFTTPVLSTTTSYWVESSSTNPPQNVGPLNTSIGTGGFYTNTTSHYLIFDALQPFTLNTVLVNAGAAGNRTIQLRNSSGVVIQQTTVNLPSGTSTVTLNFDVPVGTSMQLGVQTANSNLYRNSSGTNYPYEIPGVVSIHSNSAGNNAYYYYFYNWEITTECTSAREEVLAVFDSQSGSAGIAISADDNSVCPGEDITFTAVPTNGGTSPVYDWQVNGNSVGSTNPITLSGLTNSDQVVCIITSSDPCLSTNTATSNNVTVIIFSNPATPVISLSGSDLTSDIMGGNQWYLDGNPISGATNDSYTPTQNGSYFTVITDANGCVSDTSNVIVVNWLGITESELNSVRFYPNPNDGFLQIDNSSGTLINIELKDETGRLVLKEKIAANRQTIYLQNISSGIYFLELSNENSVRIDKLVIR